MKILVMGHPGSGKTTLADKIGAWLSSEGYTVERLNADAIRSQYDDWDFSIEGRMRQAQRIANLANKSPADIVVADFVAALSAQREVFDADQTIWMDTLQSSQYEDTNKAFVPPTSYTHRITSFKEANHAVCI